ncbi:MAG: PEP-CTERM sorting domain-containing protein [Spirulinaceae cyanobacterium]
MSFIKFGLTQLSIAGAIATITSIASPLYAQTIKTNATPEQPLNSIYFSHPTQSGGIEDQYSTFRLFDPLVNVNQPQPTSLSWAGNSTLSTVPGFAFMALEPHLHPSLGSLSPGANIAKYYSIPETNDLFNIGGLTYAAGNGSFPNHGFGRNPQTGEAQFTPFQWRFSTGIRPVHLSNRSQTLLTDGEKIDLLGSWMDMGVTMDGSQPRFILPNIQNTRYTFGIDDLWYEFELVGFLPSLLDQQQLETALTQFQAGEQEHFNSLLIDEWVPNIQNSNNLDSLSLAARMLIPTKERNPNATILDIEVDGESVPPTEEPQLEPTPKPQPEAVPEPGLLLGLGAIALGAFRLRRDRP